MSSEFDTSISTLSESSGESGNVSSSGESSSKSGNMPSNVPDQQLTTEQKIDKILELVSKNSLAINNTSTLIKYEQRIKNEVKSFMLKNYNISFIRDDIEENIYDIFFDELFSILNKII